MTIKESSSQPARAPGYRRCVGLAVFNRDGLVFVGRRHGGSGRVDLAHAWQMPQGGIDRGETPYEAALRELHEETNVKSVRLLGEAPNWLTYDLPPRVAGQAWRGRFRGQTQKWFAFRFEGADDEIDIGSPAGGQRPEFSEWRWERLDRVPSLIIPFKRDVYEEVAAAFARFAQPEAAGKT